MKNIDHLIVERKLQEIVSLYTANDLAIYLPFRKGLVLSKYLLENKDWDSDLQEFAIELIEKIKRHSSKEWNQNWKHEAYLGYAYSVLGWDIEKEFDAFHAAAEKSIKPSIEVLMHMGILWSYPGVYGKKINEKIAIEILEKVANEVPYIEAIEALIRIYEETNQQDKIKYWLKILKQSKEQEIYDHHPYLDFFQDYLADQS